MKKRSIALISTGACIFGLFAGAAASGFVSDIKAQLRQDFTVVIDGEEKVFKNVQGEQVYPLLYNGTTYLPIRAIGEIMGKTVYWYENEKRIELKEEITTVTDADVIIGGADAPANIIVSDKKQIDTSSFIGEEKAKEIALSKAGLSTSDVIFKKTKLDFDDGIWHYEIEFRQNRTEYEADIKADDGSILKWEIDRN